MTIAIVELTTTVKLFVTNKIFCFDPENCLNAELQIA